VSSGVSRRPFLRTYGRPEATLWIGGTANERAALSMSVSACDLRLTRTAWSSAKVIRRNRRKRRPFR
jgi:hypothetical protein